MAKNAAFSTQKGTISGRKQKNLTDPNEIVHIHNKAKCGWTLCGIKGGYYTNDEPDCVVCLDLHEIREL